MKAAMVSVLSFVMMATTAACTTGKAPSSSGELRPPEGLTAAEAALGPGEKIAVIGSSQSSDMDGFLDCLEAILRKANPALRIVPDKSFRGELFPWFEPGTAPDTDDELAALLRQSAVRERIAALDVRYVVAVSGYSSSTNAKAFGDAYSFGITSDVRSSFSARVWDIARAKSVGTIRAKASGPAGGGIIILIPFAFGPDAENKVCNDVGWRLAQFFSGGKLVKPETDRAKPPQTPAAD